MKKFFLALVLLFATFEIFGNIPVVPNTAAMVAANQAAMREQKHRREYHNGPMDSYSEYVDIWERDKEGNYIICTYEKFYYYYQKDPKKCIQSTCTKGPIETRYPTEQEINERKRVLIILIISISVTVFVLIVYIIFLLISDYKINKRVSSNPNLTHYKS